MTSQPVQPDRRATESSEPATVLIVDDSNAIRAILRRSLEAAGYQVSEASNGEEGLAAARSQHPSLVLLDVDMPVMDGLETMRTIHADSALKSIPVLFLTARTDGLDVAAGLGLGAQDYLRKPCEPAELTARVATALRLKAQTSALQEQTQLLDSLSSTDPLTGLGNRRFLESRINDLAAEFGENLEVGALLVDIDHFKDVNDRFGHPVGDTVLQILAARLQTASPPDSVLVRWGGEEFLVVSPGLAGDDLATAGERVRAAINEAPFAVGIDRLLDLTISVGAAVGQIANLHEVTAAADVALYEAKETGRNRVCGPTAG